MFNDQTELFTKTHFLETSKFRPIDHESISKNPINIKTLDPYVSKNDNYKMLPLEAPKRSYGTVKCHQPNLPFRPIVKYQCTYIFLKINKTRFIKYLTEYG